ncbi:alpha carbonic anhydrase 7 [Artemisia annua]|uniref:Alpha carbonic anhydrase 7 n=1 Tax=Artemisia annua TaxID=35608 RepID=A0A2U1PM02_ARTAN|nr:alpha carbonic anhydrase 7 [Artemisia annua]
MNNKSLFSSIFIVLFIIFCVPLALSQEVDDENEFSYDVNSPNGPNNWGGMCNQGHMQSPIDIADERVETTSKLGVLERDYTPSNATVMNRGYDIMLRWIGGGGSIRINGTEYQLNQIHWHTPTEHAINGQRFDLELHIVHQSADEKIAVVGILYEIGSPDSFLLMIEPYLRAVAPTKGVELSVGIIDPRQIEFGSIEYYRYNGSLTTPPCSENVTWTIVNKIRTASLEQVLLIREAIQDETGANARPLQALNDRLDDWGYPNVDIDGADLVACPRLVGDVRLTNKKDDWGWNMEGHSVYSVKESKQWLLGPVNRDESYRYKWCKWLPIKCNIFMWRANVDRIPTMTALRRRNIVVGDGWCALCGEAEETTDHIFTACSVASGVWGGISSWCKISPLFMFSIKDVLQSSNHLDGSKTRKEVIYGLLILTCWCLWKARNDKIFNNREANVVQIVSDVKVLGFLWYSSRFKEGKVDWKGWCHFRVDLM